MPSPPTAPSSATTSTTCRTQKTYIFSYAAILSPNGRSRTHRGVRVVEKAKSVGRQRRGTQRKDRPLESAKLDLPGRQFRKPVHILQKLHEKNRKHQLNIDLPKNHPPQLPPLDHPDRRQERLRVRRWFERRRNNEDQYTITRTTPPLRRHRQQLRGLGSIGKGQELANPSPPLRPRHLLPRPVIFIFLHA